MAWTLHSLYIDQNVIGFIPDLVNTFNKILKNLVASRINLNKIQDFDI